jgi:hypothetical protein
MCTELIQLIVFVLASRVRLELVLLARFLNSIQDEIRMQQAEQKLKKDGLEG